MLWHSKAAESSKARGHRSMRGWTCDEYHAVRRYICVQFVQESSANISRIHWEGRLLAIYITDCQDNFWYTECNTRLYWSLLTRKQIFQSLELWNRWIFLQFFVLDYPVLRFLLSIKQLCARWFGLVSTRGCKCMQREPLQCFTGLFFTMPPSSGIPC